MTCRNLKLLFAITSLLLTRDLFARYVSYSLNPSQAENVLATLAERPRILDDKWLQLLGNHANESYTIRPGDNLWKISNKMLGNSFYWSKLWEANPDLSNPHNLEKGQTIRFYRPNVSRGLASSSDAKNEIRIPLIKLLPEKRGGVADIDQDAVFNVDLKNRFSPRFFVLTPENTVYGTLTGTYVEGFELDLHEAVYIKTASDKLKVGEKYAIAHPEKPLRDETQDDAPIVGELVQVVGKVEIQEVGEHLVKAKILELQGNARRGDKIIDIQPSVNFALQFEPPDKLQCQIIMGEEPDYHIFGQGQLVVLNKGSESGMKPGFLFRVWRDYDPLTNKDADVEPSSAGEVQIIHVGPVSSVGFITRNSVPLKAGDTLVPRQTFSNPTSMKVKAREPHEIK